MDFYEGHVRIVASTTAYFDLYHPSLTERKAVPGFSPRD